MTSNEAMSTDDEEVIGLEEGWRVCRDTGVQPFITRIETAFDDNEFERCTIKAGTYMEVYEYVTYLHTDTLTHNICTHTCMHNSS